MRDLTPASLGETVRVLFAPFSASQRISRDCASVFSESESARLKRMSINGQQAEFAQRRAFRRFCAATALGSGKPLGEIAFHETDKGRPFLSDRPELWFSFSSCRFGMIGAWSFTHGVGVDMEDQTREQEALSLARQYFTTDEAAALETQSQSARLPLFYRLWSLKEAALKSIGEGLPFGLHTFELDSHSGLRFVNIPAGYGKAEQFRAHEIPVGMTRAALVTRSRIEVFRDRNDAASDQSARRSGCHSR
jgi:4'-phosphopantetheinyl transferase